MAEPASADERRGEARLRLTRAFAAAGLEAPAFEARLLLAHALGLDGAGLAASPEAPVGAGGAARLAGLAARRLAREPIGRILGERDFFGLPFRLSPATLEPRPDTETLVEAGLEALPARGEGRRLLDLGTGCGCVLLAILAERPGATGLGLDRSREAVITARENARALGLAARALFAVGDWTAPIAARFDLVISNPPYIETATIAGLEPEVRLHDPRAALDGGRDGLDAYRAIFRGIGACLAPTGLLALEHGAGQGPAVAGLARRAGLGLAGIRRDLSAHERVMIFTMNA